jgi:F-box/leucine-rich repeat protein 10/11
MLSIIFSSLVTLMYWVQDWHIDFAGSSVYYHILRGSKVRAEFSRKDQYSSPYQVFYFIRPTQANLAAYERWSGTELQYQSWLGDMVDEVFKVELKEGNTMIIPSGWIHAVVRRFFSRLQRY